MIYRQAGRIRGEREILRRIDREDHVAVRVSPPPVPVTVTLVIPSAAVPDAASVSVLLVPVVDAGLNVAVTPVGSPLALKATLEEKPASGDRDRARPARPTIDR